MPAPLRGYDDVTSTVPINAALDRLLLACAGTVPHCWLMTICNFFEGFHAAVNLND